MNLRCGMLVFLLFSAAPGGFAVESLELVKDGKARAAFLLPSHAGETEKLAAKEFADYVQRITSVKIPVTEKAPEGMIPIHSVLSSSPDVPERLKASVKRLEYDGFALDVSGEGVWIVSAKKRGLLYGVYHLLREYGGVIWFHPDPTEEGEFVPHAPVFRIPFQTTVKNPAFEYRRFGLNGGSLKNDHVHTWFLRNGMQLFVNSDIPKLRVFDPIYKEGGHDMTTLLVGYAGTNREMKAAEQKLYREHPEYFGLDSKGIRRIGGNNVRNAVQPCTGNPEVLKRMADHALQRIARFRGAENIRTLCNDDHPSWCLCENCRKLDDPAAPRSNRHADRWWHFVNYMAQRILTPGHPENKLNALVYQTFRYPPKTVKPDPRVFITICPHQRCYIHSLNDPSCPVNAGGFRQMFEEWHKAGMRSDTFEYHTQLPGATRYLPMERAWVRDLQYYKSLNMAGFGFITRAALSDFGPRKSPFNEHMWMSLWQQHWLTAYYSWNIDADFDTVSEKINSRYYGPAWRYMKPYREELTRALYAPKVHMGYGTPDTALGRCGESAGLFDRLHGYLDRAEQAAEGDRLLLKRIGRDRLFLKLSWEDACDQYKQIKQKEYSAKRLSGTLQIDGRLDEDAWRTAQVITDFKKAPQDEAVGKTPADPQTFVRILHDNDNLYFGIEAMKPKNGKTLDVATSDGIPGAMKGSHIEIFLTPPELNGKYYHFGFTRNGRSFQALTDSPATRDEKVRINFQFKITDAPDRWIAEVKAPVRKISSGIREGSTWKLNIGRAALNKEGKMEYSSMCAGLFHGSSGHRTMAFGERGAIVKNGDFEETGKPRIKKHLKKHWEYRSGTVPLQWWLNEGNTGAIEVRTGDAASGNSYIRVAGLNAFVEQPMTIPADRPERYSFTMRVRGRGELLVRIRNRLGKYFGNALQKIDSGQWIPVSGIIDCVPDGRNMFTLRITGTLDIDDVRVEAEAPEEMPDASKHQI